MRDGLLGGIVGAATADNCFIQQHGGVQGVVAQLKGTIPPKGV